jgi:hypothetical protein
MASYTTNDIVQTLLKKSLGYANTNSANSVLAEYNAGSYAMVLSSQITAETIPLTGVPSITDTAMFTSPSTVDLYSSDTILNGSTPLKYTWTANPHLVYYSQIVLTRLDKNINNAFSYGNFIPLDTNILTNIVPQYIPTDGTKYTIYVEYWDSDNAKWVGLGSNNYLLDRDAGVLTIYGNDGSAGAPTISSANPPRISYWRYEGNFGTSSGSGISSITFDSLNQSSVSNALNNTAVGSSALSSNTTGSNNTALGFSALKLNTASNNTALGFSALKLNTTGTYNTAIGFSALTDNITGINNTALGYSALKLNTASNNTALGYNALTNNITGNNNTAIGSSALKINTVSYNTAIGSNALSTNITGINNTALGYSALKLNTASNNTALGYNALSSNTSGTYNIAISSDALSSNTTGIDNIAIGYGALKINTASNNTAIGSGALSSNINGNNNVAIGFSALSLIGNGSGNTAIGSRALINTSTGNNNTAIGSSPTSYININTGYNNTTIGYNANPSSITINNEITLGDANIAMLRCVKTVITALSDARDKTDVTALPTSLTIIEKLNPVLFKWDKREWYENGVSDGSKKTDTIQVGFLAQELKQVQEELGCPYLDLVYESNPDKLEATYGNLLIPLIKAVQELSQQVKELKVQVSDLQNLVP